MTARKTRPSVVNPFQPFDARKVRPFSGLRAERICGASKMWIAPRTAMVEKNSSMIGPKSAATRAVPDDLHHEKGDQDGDRDRQDIVREIEIFLDRLELQSFDGGQHGDRGRDDRVAAEQARARDAQHEDERRAAPNRLLRHRHQRQRAAFAAVVRAHDEQHVFDRDDEEQRPQKERDDADDLARFRAAGLGVGHRRLHRIKGACADVAVDHAGRAEDHRPEARGMDGRMERPCRVLGRGGRRAGCGLVRNVRHQVRNPRRSPTFTPDIRVACASL